LWGTPYALDEQAAVLLFHPHFVGDPACRETTATHGVSVPARMKFTAAELTEIRHAFRQRLATERVPKKPARRKRKPKPPSLLIREPDYDDTYLLTPALVAELFAVSPRTVRRWADAGILPSFRTLGGQRRFRWGQIRRVISAARATPPSAVGEALRPLAAGTVHHSRCKR
jgi:excisionase family DNA binding protein